MSLVKVVCIGGGTGLSVLLRGLKNYPLELTALVTVADDGGSSGKIRSDMNIPSPGDLRNVIAALSDVEPELEKMFQYRFDSGQISGHPVGNLMIAAMAD
ncbi:YvcK family protein, partial [Streptococcus danieliae]|nr:YvcK family protein [Streptococcus danieliae]